MGLTSIIVPLYNKEKTIEKCLASIKYQTYSNIECIIVNDGSIDDSKRIAFEFCQEDSRFKLISQENKGVSSARNAGLKASNGEYIVFIDSDDYVENNYVEELINPLQDDNASLSICNKYIEKSDYYSNQIKKVLDDFGASYDYKIYNTPWGKGYKKKLIKDKFIEGLSIGEDLMFNLKYMISCQHMDVIYKTSDAYKYTYDDDSLSNRVSEKKLDDLVYVINKCNDELNKQLDTSKIVLVQSKSLFKSIYEFYKNNHDALELIFEKIHVLKKSKDLFVIIRFLLRIESISNKSIVLICMLIVFKVYDIKAWFIGRRVKNE